MKKVINVEVIVRKKDSIEACIKRFAKKVKKSGILDDYIDHMHMPEKKRKKRKKRKKK